jgi:glycosyltransferase involved in cell wall biosynthesis
MTPNKKRILVFIDWFYPAYKAGGPVKSVFNLVQALQSEFQFSIVTSNQDVDGEVLDVEPNAWTEVRGIPIIYLSKEKQRAKVYRELFKEKQADAVYYNSLFSKKFTLKPYRALKRYNCPQIIAPRGMLGSGALAIKPLKKKAFLKLSKQLFFSSKQTLWHATSEQEAEEIRAAFGKKTNIRIAQNLSSAMVERGAVQKEEGALKLIFLSRLAEKKNLVFALELMQALKSESGLSLDIYGPIEEQAYWKKCEKIIEMDARIQYKGVLKPHEIAATLQQYHFYILPTQHENYGHSIVEALLAGLPIIISQATPWRALQKAGVGADLDLNKPNDWISYLQEALSLSQKSYEEMVQNCFSYAEEHVLSPAVVEDSRKLFLF